MIDTSTITTVPAAVVPVTSGWFSKINWTQAVQAIAAVLVIATGGKISLDPQQQLAIVGGIVVVGNILTIVLKTYFTSTVTPQSVTATTTKTTIGK